MKASFLILGREPSLALAEITARYGAEAIFLAGAEAVIVPGEDIGRAAAAVLGSVKKAGVILEEVKQITVDNLAAVLAPFLQAGKKFTFGLSFYRLDHPPTPSLVKEGERKRLGLEVKKILKAAGASVRLVESRNDNLSSVDVVKNKLLSGGVELCIIKTKDTYQIGQTLAVQPFEEYSERDYDRPGRDTRVGMLPPKLAKAMINIAVGNNHNLTILDPFCGSGTVLQEALLMGYECLGTDVDARAIANSKINLEWLQGKYKNLPSWQVKPADAKQLGEIMKPGSVDAIVSEFYLGPALRGHEARAGIIKTEAELSALYALSLAALHKVIKPARRAALAWPYFRQYNIFISAFGQLKELGWEVVPPYSQFYTADFPLSKRGTLIYGRPGQYVFREIVILEKK